MKHHMQQQGGFTLIEIVITIVLISAMMAGMSALFVENVGNSHRPYLRQKSLAVANAFMEEIQHKRWNENTPIGGGCINTGASCGASLFTPAGIGTDGGESRTDYDDVDDYNAINNQSPPEDSSGTAMPGFDGFTVTVAVTQPSAAWNGIAAADVREIVVSVTSPTNETISLTSYRVNY